MGKIRVAVLGDEELEKKLKKRAEKRREAKKEKKIKPEEQAPLAAEPTAPTETAPVQQKEKTKTPKKPGAKVRSKKYEEARKLIERNKLYPLVDAVSLVKQTSISSFDGTVEAHMRITVQGGKDKADYRGSVTFPFSTGKDVRVAIADEPLIGEIEKGIIRFDVLISHPSMMPKLARVARILGPKGLMPNPKNGTVTDKTEEKAKQLSSGTVNFKSEPGQPIIHMRIGKVSQNDRELIQNIQALAQAVGKPNILKLALAPTIGPGVKVDIESI